MIYTTGTSGRIEGLRMMTKVESGSHLGMSLVHCRKVSAMILEPVSTGVVLHRLYLMFMQCVYHVVSHCIMSYVCNWSAAASAVRVCIDSNCLANFVQSCLPQGLQLLIC